MERLFNQFVILIALAIFIVNSQSCHKNSDKTIELSSDMEKITWNDSIQYKCNPFKKNVRYVAYVKPEAMTQTMPQYIYYIKNYPEVGFIFIFSSNEKKTIKKKLINLEFPIPAFIEADNKFRKYGFIAFIVNKNNEVVSTTNPSLPDFEETLKEAIKNSRN